MIIPLQSLSKLKIGFGKKLSLYVLFAAGSFAMAASIVRTTMSIKQPNSIAPVILWSVVEETVVNVVANAPMLRVLVFPGQNFASSHHSTTGYTRERSTHDRFEMNPKSNLVTVVSSPGANDIPAVDKDTKNSDVLRTVEVRVENHGLKGEDGSLSETSTWAP